MPVAPTVRSLPLQFAWCGRLADAAGRYGGERRGRLEQATHGICPDCTARTLADWDEARRAEGPIRMGQGSALAPA